MIAATKIFGVAMSNFRLSTRSLSRLQGVHPDLVAVAKLAIKITKYDFGIYEGVRTQALQNHYVETGRSTTRHSLHLVQFDDFSHAFDFYALDENGKYVSQKTHPGKVHGYYRKIMQAFVTAAVRLGVEIELGGLWQTFIDGPHIQLSRTYRQGRYTTALNPQRRNSNEVS